MANRDTLVPGSIMRLQLKYFMTYDNIEYYPVPGLNMIIGPNGSGKSTIICGICLGLGGKPSSMSRVNQISEFVKIGHNSALIEIELFDPSKETNLVISREISSNNSSSWKINGKQTTLKMVEKEVSRFNIQCNNLCQFLPQEKVADFSKMNSRELLESTEQAVGDQSMFEYHRNLKTARARHCELLKVLKNHQDNLSLEEESNKRLETDVELYNKREKYLERIKQLEKKIPWVKYNNARLDHQNTKKHKEEISRMVKEIEVAVKADTEALQKSEEQVKEHERVLEEIGLGSKKIKNDFSRVSQKIELHDNKISDAKFYFGEKEKEEVRRINEIKHLQGMIDSWKAEVLDLEKSETATTNELARIDDKIQKVHYLRIENCTKKESSLAEKNALQNELDVHSRSLGKLREEEANNLPYTQCDFQHILHSVHLKL